MQEHSINTEKFTAIWILSYGTDSIVILKLNRYRSDYDLHQYTLAGELQGFEHHLDINSISTAKEKEEPLKIIFETIRQVKIINFSLVFSFSPRLCYN